MHAEELIATLLFIVTFLAVTAVISAISKWAKVPYTVLLLVVGFWAQAITHFIGLSTHVEISTDLIYFFLLPLLLFESAFHINLHQFRLQFKTITFLATFGLLISVFAVGVLLFYALGLPFTIALLFGAIISATDPIAVLAIFKELGAPKRLSLVADGESMFNDATGVMVFRIVSGIVLAQGAFQFNEITQGITSFLWIFIGSIIVGAVLGYITSSFIFRVKNDRLVETTLTIALAIGSFVIAEHFFHLSGVISTVVAAIVFGNYGRTRISYGVVNFIEEMWEYVGFIALSVIFFFATYTLNISQLLGNPVQIGIVILSVLIARAISVYITIFFSNRSRYFANEPNIPLAWQHVLVWGGLRGVIPLVLVYSLPEDFVYKELMLQFTLSTFLFTLFINATTIKKLLYMLKLHLPRKEEQIAEIEEKIFALENVKEKLELLPHDEFDTSIIKQMTRSVKEKEEELHTQLESLATPAEFEQSIRLQTIEIERQTIEELFHQNHISENVVYEFESELDLQQDVLEHPTITHGARAVRDDGKIDSSKNFAQKIRQLSQWIKEHPWLGKLMKQTKRDLIKDRLAVLQARIIASTKVVEYLQKVKKLLNNNIVSVEILNRILSEHEHMRLRNHYQMQAIQREYPRTYEAFERELVHSYAWEIEQE